jgi:hypothetical protein
MNVERRVAASLTNDDSPILLVPFENGTGPDAQALAYFRGNGDLPLGRQL